jgi:hypothetical protein
MPCSLGGTGKIAVCIAGTESRTYWASLFSPSLVVSDTDQHAFWAVIAFNLLLQEG